jgi:hypothetical protein
VQHVTDPIEQRQKVATLKNVLAILLVLVVAVFMTTFGVGIGVDMFFNADPRAVEAYRGGFVGAFFAFLFVRVGDLLSRWFEQQRRNSDALMALQLRYVEAWNVLSNNNFVWEYWSELVKERGEIVNLWTNRLRQVNIPGERLHELLNLDLLNELVDLNTRLTQVNDDTEAFGRTYEVAAEGLLSEKIDLAGYRENLRRMNIRRAYHQESTLAVMGDIDRALAAIRVLIGDRTIGQAAIKLFTPRVYWRTFDTQRALELSGLRAEAAARTEANRARIQDFEKKAADRAHADQARVVKQSGEGSD